MAAWQVLGIMPSLRKSATLEQTDTWRKVVSCLYRHLVGMLNKFASEDKLVNQSEALAKD
jgi:hypothetical protein